MRQSLLLGAAAVLLLAVGYAGGVAHERSRDEPVTTSTVRPPSQLAVPDLVGEPVDRALDRLAGLAFRSVVRSFRGEPGGTVVDQEPGAGTIVDRGSLVLLTEGED